MFVWPSVSLVHDIDNTESNEYGEYYSQRRPLTSAERKKAGDIGSVWRPDNHTA